MRKIALLLVLVGMVFGQYERGNTGYERDKVWKAVFGVPGAQDTVAKRGLWKIVAGDNSTTDTIGKIGLWQRVANMPFINVVDYGAHPDSSADANRIAIQAAIDDARILGGSNFGVVYIPSINGSAKNYYEVSLVPGKHYAIRLYSGVRIVGDWFRSEGGSVIKLANNQVLYGQEASVIADNNYLVYIGDETGSLDWWHWAGIENLLIDCNGSNQSGKINGISIYKPGESSYLQNIYIKNFKGIGVEIASNSSPLRITNLHLFPDASADTLYNSLERIGVEFNGGTNSAQVISGDRCVPLIKINNSGQYSFIGIKHESGGEYYPIPFVLDTVEQFGAIFITGMRADNGSSNAKAVIEVYGNTGNIPQLIIASSQVIGFRNLVWYNLGGSIDSIRDGASASTNQNINFFSWGNSGMVRFQQGFEIPYNVPIYFEDHLGNWIKTFQYKSDQQFHIISPRDWISLEGYDGSVIQKLHKTRIEQKVATSFEQGAYFGTYGVENDKVEKVYINATNDSLIIKVNGAEYAIPKR